MVPRRTSTFQGTLCKPPYLQLNQLPDMKLTLSLCSVTHSFVKIQYWYLVHGRNNFFQREVNFLYFSQRDLSVEKKNRLFSVLFYLFSVLFFLTFLVFLLPFSNCSHFLKHLPSLPFFLVSFFLISRQNFPVESLWRGTLPHCPPPCYVTNLDTESEFLFLTLIFLQLRP